VSEAEQAGREGEDAPSLPACSASDTVGFCKRERDGSHNQVLLPFPYLLGKEEEEWNCFRSLWERRDRIDSSLRLRSTLEGR